MLVTLQQPWRGTAVFQGWHDGFTGHWIGCILHRNGKCRLCMRLCLMHNIFMLWDNSLDLPIYPIGKDEKARLYHEMGFVGVTQDTVFLMGASLWPGEEDMVLEALVQLRQQDVDARVILVPRHAEKGRLLVQAAKTRGLVFSQRSTSLSSSEKVVVHVADTTGEMHRLCQCVDVALIGKSFSPYRGGRVPSS